MADEVRRLPGAVGSIRDYHVGPDAGVNPGKNYDFAVVAEFDDVDGYLAYRDHPAHRAVVEDYVNPIVARRADAQHETRRLRRPPEPAAARRPSEAAGQ